MSSLFAQYKKEREGAHVVEDENGFATAIPLDDHFYIDEIFVAKGYRKQNFASSYADKLVEIARKLNYNKILGSVDVNANNATTSVKVLLAYGMHLHSVDGNIIYFEKNIKEEEKINIKETIETMCTKIENNIKIKEQKRIKNG